MANETVVSLEDRMRALEAALAPFANAIAYVGPAMSDDREILLAFARQDGPDSKPAFETTDTLPTMATVGDLRRAAKLLGLAERT